MSRTLSAKKLHLHSPVDDLESFFWVAVWSVFFNKDHKEDRSDEEKSIMELLAGCRKDDAMREYSTLVPNNTTSDIVQHLQAVLYDWWMKVRDRDVTWTNEVVRGAPEEAGEEYYLPRFHRFALEGVADVLEVLLTHWDNEAGWKSWAPET